MSNNIEKKPDLLIWMEEENKLKLELKILKGNIEMAKSGVIKQMQDKEIYKLSDRGLLIERKIKKTFSKENEDLIDFLKENAPQLLFLKTTINAVWFKKTYPSEYLKNIVETEYLSVIILSTDEEEK